MGDQYSEIMSAQFNNAQINASASADFGNDWATIAKKDRWGSFNRLIITSMSSNDHLVLLDGGDRKFFLYARGKIIIDPKDGIFFSHARISNLSGTTATTASDLNIYMARANPIN